MPILKGLWTVAEEFPQGARVYTRPPIPLVDFLEVLTGILKKYRLRAKEYVWDYSIFVIQDAIPQAEDYSELLHRAEEFVGLVASLEQKRGEFIPGYVLAEWKLRYMEYDTRLPKQLVSVIEIIAREEGISSVVASFEYL